MKTCFGRACARCSVSTYPSSLAPFGPWDQVDLAASVSNAGALGSLGTAVRSSDELREQWARQGASLGTRFLATEEMSLDPAWKQRIVEAGALDAVKVEMSERVLPPFTLPQVGRPAPGL